MAFGATLTICKKSNFDQNQFRLLGKTRKCICIRKKIMKMVNSLLANLTKYTLYSTGCFGAILKIHHQDVEHYAEIKANLIAKRNTTQLPKQSEIDKQLSSINQAGITNNNAHCTCTYMYMHVQIST